MATTRFIIKLSRLFPVSGNAHKVVGAKDIKVQRKRIFFKRILILYLFYTEAIRTNLNTFTLFSVVT